MSLLDLLFRKKYVAPQKSRQDELELKRKELFEAAEKICGEKQFFKDIYDRLRDIKSMPSGPEKDKRTDALLSVLGEKMSYSRELQDFYYRSEVLYNDYLIRLTDKFPGLTEAERKLALLLHQGFSGRQIATLMDITPKSVEISRYRLRMKLELGKNDNLLQVIESV